MTSPDSRYVPRDRFLANWRYGAGEHVTVIAPTGWGKSHFTHELLDRAVSPQLPAVSLVMKPRDSTVDRFNRELRFKRVRRWPPRTLPFQQAARGYTLWPRQSRDLDDDSDESAMRAHFLAAMNHAYGRGRWIVFADEVAGLSNELGLKKPLTRLWMRGRSLGVGLWAATQRPVDIPLHAYSAAEHLFLGNDPDARARERYGEIGGIDQKVVIGATSKLRRYEWLYIRRSAQDYRVIGR